MGPRERILAIKLLEKQQQNPAYAAQLGVQVCIKRNINTRENADINRNAAKETVPVEQV